MFGRLIPALGIVILLFSIAGASSAGANSQACRGGFTGSTLQGPFEAFVTSGPDTGLTLTGTLTLHVGASGAISGVLVTPDGQELAVSGRIQRQAIALIIELGDGLAIHGVGRLPVPCTDPITGSLHGPRGRDSGHWGFAWGS